MHRFLPLVVLLAVPTIVVAQAVPDAAACNVAPGSLEVNDAGELVRPPPTVAACERARTLQTKFLETSPRDFRLVRNMGRLPDSVRAYLGGIEPVGDRGNPVRVQVGRTDELLPGLVVWLGTELVVMAYRVSDLAGTTTTVVLADLDSLNVCSYLRWRGGALPATLSIEDIQAALDRGSLGNREVPVCSLELLPLD